MIKLGDIVPIPSDDGEWEVDCIVYYLPPEQKPIDDNEVPMLRPVELTEANCSEINGSRVFIYVKGKGTPFSYEEIGKLKEPMVTCPNGHRISLNNPRFDLSGNWNPHCPKCNAFIPCLP